MFLRAFSFCLIIGVLSSNVVSQDYTFEERRRSPVAAFTISAASTTIPFFIGTTALKNSPDWIGTSLISAALLVGPSMGYLYSQNSNRFKSGLFIRAGSLGMVALGGAELAYFDRLEFEDEDNDNWDALVLVVTGTAVFTYSVISDWFGAAQSAKRYNQRSWNIQPSYDFETRTPLLSLRVNF